MNNVVVLGGAGFIGSHLVERLITLGKNVVVVDNMSSGRFENVPKSVPVFELDCRNFGNCVSAMLKADTVFHLAAANGGRGYLETHATDVWNNLEIDSTVFRAAEYVGVNKFIYFSSSCVYPNYKLPYFDEDMVDYNKIEQADGAYGMAKLIGEHMLNAYVQAGKFKGIAVRPFNVYGPRMKENKAITALIAKTFIKQDPLEVWGSGMQSVDWIYVDDVVDAVILAAENMDSGAVNIGTGIPHSPLEVVDEISDYIDWSPKSFITTDNKSGYPKMADTIKLNRLGWEQKVCFADGIRKSVDWYYATHSMEDVRKDFERKLLER